MSNIAELPRAQSTALALPETEVLTVLRNSLYPGAADESCANEAARLAYRVADAMLRERAR